VRPEHGGRLELRLAEAAPTTARYTVTLYLPRGDAGTTAVLNAESGAVELEPWRGPPPPEWLESFTRSLLRTVLRSKGTEGEWPRRLTRWRAEPER